MRRNSACPSCTLITTVDLALILNFKYNASKKTEYLNAVTCKHTCLTSHEVLNRLIYETFLYQHIRELQTLKTDRIKLYGICIV